MSRRSILHLFIALVALSYRASAFTFPCGKSAFMSRTTRYMNEQEEIEIVSTSKRIPTVERGVSMDQDGKSNVWAIEPKVEIDSKSAEEKGAQALLAGGGLAAFAVLAGVILSNLPDPNQF